MSAYVECAYCLSSVEQDTQIVNCPSCGTIYHQECWIDSGGCCSPDCPEVVRHLELDIQSEQTDMLVLTSESVQSAIPHKQERKWNPCLRCGRHVPTGDLYCNSCTPEPEGSQDAKNAGPLMIVLLLAALTIFWLIYFSSGPSDNQEAPPPPGHGDARR